MVDAPDILDDGAPDEACATCGHSGEDHMFREIEVAGGTIRQSYCESCDADCDFVPMPDGPRKV